MPRLLQGTLQALGDVYTYKLAQRFFGKEVAFWVVSLPQSQQQINNNRTPSLSARRYRGSRSIAECARSQIHSRKFWSLSRCTIGLGITLCRLR